MKSFLKQIIFFVIALFSFTISKGLDITHHQNFVIASDKIYMLASNGDLLIYSAYTGRLLSKYQELCKIKMLLQDHLNNIIIVNDSNEVKKLDVIRNTWSTIATYKGAKLYAVAFNNDNECFLITDKGVTNNITNKTYYPDAKLSHSEWAYHGSKAWFNEDDVQIPTFIDEDNNLWVLFSHGEWGNDMFIFNTTNNVFGAYRQITAIPVFQFNRHLISYESGMLGSYVYQYDKVSGNKNDVNYIGSIKYSADSDITFPSDKRKVINFYIGGFTYNRRNKNLYVITSDGLFKANIVKPISKYSDWTIVKTFKMPKHIQRAMFPDKKNKAVYNMEYVPDHFSKIQFAQNGKLVLLDNDFGIWIFDGKKLIEAK